MSPPKPEEQKERIALKEDFNDILVKLRFAENRLSDPSNLHVMNRTVNEKFNLPFNYIWPKLAA